MVELLYALNGEGRMLHINEVPNGISCRCYCPGCSAPLVAKNNGETIAPHFAHASGIVCNNAHESELHLLAKEIINEEKKVMLPSYGSIYKGGIIRFDCIEVEKRNDIKLLQPDLCGVVYNKVSGSERRLWIEIMVTHAIGPDKRALIVKEGIACVEINLSQFMNRQVTRKELKDFLLNDQTAREWTNNPLLEQKRLSMAASSKEYAERKAERGRDLLLERMPVNDLEEYYEEEQSTYLESHKDCCIIDSKRCYKCKHHTTRKAIFEEIKRLHLPSWIKDALSSNLLYWTHDNVIDTVVYNKCYTICYDGFLRILPVTTPDVHGRPVSQREMKQNEKIIPFLLNTVPAIIASEGLKCGHNVQSFSTTSCKYKIACNMPNVVNRRRKR